MPRSQSSVDTRGHLYHIDQIAPPLSWTSLFENDQPVELEIGCGKGLFLANAGSRHPDVNYCGIEISRKYATIAAQRVAKHSLHNVKVLIGDARIVLDRFVADRSVRAVHVYFPDPWWKKRHRKRRVFSEPFVDRISKIVRNEGDLWIATDVEDYYQEIHDIVGRHPDLTELPSPTTHAPEHDLDYLTNFERKFRIEGRPILRARFRIGTEETPERARHG